VAGHGLALSGVIGVADASPLHYLILIGHIDLLPTLFIRILVLATITPVCDRIGQVLGTVQLHCHTSLIAQQVYL
jgi:hypothetical protein